MDNSPRESLGKIEKDTEFSLSANINTEDSRLEWEDEAKGIFRVIKRRK
jgi:methionyl-tRNA formyltransferase